MRLRGPSTIQHTILRVTVCIVMTIAANMMMPFIPLPVAAASAGPALRVDATANRHAINPEIYGMDFADPALARELRLPVDRWGGDATSRYNWQTNTSNTGSDYYFENIYQDSSIENIYQHQSADQFIDADRAHQTKSVMTVPLIGYVSKASPHDHPYACAFGTDLYGPQQAVDPWDPRCGSGLRPNGTNVTGNNPLDTSIAIGPSFDQQWVTHFVSRYGTAASGGVAYYDLDNEPTLWGATHRDVHPTEVTYDELTGTTTLYAAAVKAGDPTAQVLGPSDWGWPAYFDTNVAGDRAAHGNLPLARWYLQQMHAYEQRHGTRILDYFDEHFYPQSPGVALGTAGDAATQALRLRSTRSLWDPTYVSEDWINAPIALIPTFRGWVASDYPGTKLAIGEYNWGGLESVNGALAEADVLGIFGREGMDVAALWDPPTASQPGAFAFRMYRNYDGLGSTYGDTWVQSTSADQSQLAIYGAQRTSDKAMTLMVINKTGGALTSTLALAGYTPAPAAQAYTYSQANAQAILRQPDLSITASGLTATFPANSITMIVMTPGTPAAHPAPRPAATMPAATVPIATPPAPVPSPRQSVPIVGTPAALPGRR
ncbi:MAG: glycoside hydrolase family 44 protein [Thermomicrobiales bacterium]